MMSIYYLEVEVDGFCADALFGYCHYKITAKSDEAAKKYAREKVKKLHNPSGNWFKKCKVIGVILKKETTLLNLSAAVIITNNPIIEWIEEKK